MRGAIIGLGMIFLSWPNVARPCSPAPCYRGGHLLPDGPFPARLRGLSWTPIRDRQPLEIDPDDIILMHGNERIRVTLEPQDLAESRFLIVPSVPFVESSTYSLELPITCAERSDARYFVLEPQPSAPLPSTLGTLNVSPVRRGNLMVASTGGSCAVEVDAAYVDLTVEHAAEAEPWQNTFIYTTYVDGTRWAPQRSLTQESAAGSSWMGRGVDRIFAVCSSNNGTPPPPIALAPGRHEILIEGVTVGGGAHARSDMIVVDLTCTEDPLPPDGGMEDPAPADGGVNTGALDETESGCGCRSTDCGEKYVSLLLMIAIVTRNLRRNRQRSHTHPTFRSTR
jgi:hypothetical protein